MTLIGFMGQIAGFLFFFLIVFLLWKQKGFHPDMFELLEGEEIVKMAKGDYWIKESIFRETQNSGEFAFTNKRVLFKSRFLLFEGASANIPYEEIVSIEKSMVKNIFPVAFTITTKSNDKFKFAIMKRHIYIDLINSLAKKTTD